MRQSTTTQLVSGGITILLLAGLYLLAVFKHEERQEQRENEVKLTSGCQQKLDDYGLKADRVYQSKYRLRRTGAANIHTGYSPEDVRAIQRGCNIVDDLLGQDTDDRLKRWNSDRFVRGTHTSCDQCHQSIGDKQNADGDRLVGSIGLAASWVNSDTYDRVTGLLLPFEMRQMQCFINSSNGYKPNINNDLLRDITAYSRFLAAALNLKIQHRYPEQGVTEVTITDTQRSGDDYIRGGEIYREKCSVCHGRNGHGTVVNDRVIFPAVAGPNAFNLQSRNYFGTSDTILPGFICHNMPLGQEGSLQPQECRDIAYYIGTLPRAAGDKAGPLAALWQQLMMAVIPALISAFENEDMVDG